jgi:RNA polymerase sigma-70 factor (ECF subfamily)
MQKDPKNQASDEALMQAVLEDDEAAFEELTRRFEQRLYYFAYRHVRDAEVSHDLVQETLLRVYRHRKDFRHGSRLSTWVFAILLNLCRDHGRRSGRYSSMEIPEVATAAEHSSFRREEPSPLAEVERRQLAELLAGALESLPPLQAKLLRLRSDKELSFEEAGKELGIKPAAARAAASRAYKKLKAWMRKNSGD